METITTEQRVIDVTHEIDEEFNIDRKELSFEYGGMYIRINLYAAYKNQCGFASINISTKTDEGFNVCMYDIESKYPTLSINHVDGMTETKNRTYKEWIELENTEKALKIIGKILR